MKTLNKFQLNNVSLLTPIRLELLKSGDWRDTPAPLMKCVKCGGRTNTFLMRISNWQPEKFLCLSCDKKRKN